MLKSFGVYIETVFPIHIDASVHTTSGFN